MYAQLCSQKALLVTEIKIRIQYVKFFEALSKEKALLLLLLLPLPLL